MNVIETSELCKSYNRKLVLDKVSLSVKQGEILGLVGKNGAGKTTLIRVICDVAHPTSGTYSLLGASSPADLEKARRRVAAMIEHPSLYASMNARDNLKARCILMGMDSRKMEDYITSQLEFVGLKEVAHSNKKAGNFSLGMKQRLGIAIALTGDPELLILDEPTNGLDPEGILEVRNLLLKLNKEKGITILISSHILGELSKLATRYVIIDKGRLVAEASAQEVENGGGKRLTLSTSDNAKALEIVSSLGAKGQIEGDALTIYDYEESGAIVTMIVKNGVSIATLNETKGSLEDYFLSHLSSEGETK